MGMRGWRCMERMERVERRNSAVAILVPAVGYRAVADVGAILAEAAVEGRSERRCRYWAKNFAGEPTLRARHRVHRVVERIDVAEISTEVRVSTAAIEDRQWVVVAWDWASERTVMEEIVVSENMPVVVACSGVFVAGLGACFGADQVVVVVGW